MRHRPVLTFILALAMLLLAGCGDDEPALRVDFSARQEVHAPTPKQTLTYAYLPQYSHTVSYVRHHLMVQRLAQATGLDVRQVFPDTFDAHVKMVERGEIDISYSNPFVYIQLARSGARAFARVVEASGQPDFRGQIIVRSDREDIRTLEDCRGKRWVAVDPSSAGGFLYPLGHFAEHGIHADDFAEIGFSPGPGGKQEKVVMSVFAGAYDIGSVREGTLELLRGKIDLDQIRVLATSRSYPGWLYAARKGLDPEIVDKIGKALFELDRANPEDAVILSAANMVDIIPARDSDYDSVRRLVDQLHLGGPNGVAP